MIALILFLLYFAGIATAAGFMIEKGKGPDPWFWLAVFWPLTLFGCLGAFLARRF